MVQFAPTANAAPQVPPAAPAGRENGCGRPPPKVKLPPANAPVPVLVTVSVCAALVVPATWFPNASGLGETVAVLETPVPLSETGEPATGTLPVMVTEPAAGPAVVGVNTTLMVQVLAAASVAPQVPPDLE